MSRGLKDLGKCSPDRRKAGAKVLEHLTHKERAECERERAVAGEVGEALWGCVWGGTGHRGS